MVRLKYKGRKYCAITLDVIKVVVIIYCDMNDKCISSKIRLLGAFFVSFLFIIPSKCILQMKQTRSVLTFHLRRRNSNMLGTNKKLREGFSRLFSPAGRSPKILKPRSCYGNSISVRKFYPWHLSITNIFTWCMSSLFLFFFFFFFQFP